MITLKEIKRYPDTNSVEATWVDRTITPILVNDVDEEGNSTGTTHTEMQVVDVAVKCHSYDQVQMDMLAADLGADLAEYQWIIDEVQANMIPAPVPDPAVVEQQRIASLWQAAHDYEYAEISGSAVGLLAIGVMQGKPKCTAIQNWIHGIWAEYYTRKAGVSTDTDYSICGACPYTVPELMEELVL